MQSLRFLPNVQMQYMSLHFRFIHLLLPIYHLQLYCHWRKQGNQTAAELAIWAQREMITFQKRNMLFVFQELSLEMLFFQLKLFII